MNKALARKTLEWNSRFLIMLISIGAVLVILSITADPHFPVTASEIILFYAGGLMVLLEALIARRLGRGAESNGLLSTIHGLLLIAGLALFVSFSVHDLSAQAFITGALLTTVSWIWADLIYLGQYDGWLWNIQDHHLGRLRRTLGSHLLSLVTLYFLLTCIFSPFFAFARLRDYHLGGTTGLHFVWSFEKDLVGSTGLVLLLGLLLWQLINCVVAIRKYQRFSSRSNLKLETKSLRLIWQGLRHKMLGRGDPVEGELIIRQVQIDQILWALLLALTITAIEIPIYIFFSASPAVFEFLFFMVPVALALFFGIWGHTTSSELGGLFGVLLSALIAWTLSQLFPSLDWDRDLFFLVFSAAIVAWIVGLISGILIKGINRMSLLAFTISAQPPSKTALTPNVLKTVTSSLEQGYARSTRLLLGSLAPHSKARQTPGSGLVISSYSNTVLLGEDRFHFSISARQRPLIQQLYYALCTERLVSADLRENENRVLPLLPVSFYHSDDSGRLSFDAISLGDHHYAIAIRDPQRLVRLPESTSKEYSPDELEDQRKPFGYKKHLSEFSDQMLTRSLDIKTDLFCCLRERDPSTGEANALILVGFCRSWSSTKSYITMEAEVITAEVMRALKQGLTSIGLTVTGAQSLRMFYPQVSIYDFNHDAEEAQLSSEAPKKQMDPAIEADSLQTIKEYLQELPEEMSIPTLTGNLPQKLALWFLQVVLTGIAARLGLSGIPIETLVDIIFP